MCALGAAFCLLCVGVVSAFWWLDVVLVARFSALLVLLQPLKALIASTKRPILLRLFLLFSKGFMGSEVDCFDAEK